MLENLTWRPSFTTGGYISGFSARTFTCLPCATAIRNAARMQEGDDHGSMAGCRIRDKGADLVHPGNYCPRCGQPVGSAALTEVHANEFWFFYSPDHPLS